MTDRWIVPWLAFLAEWSIRWGVVLALLAIWMVLRPPRGAATRHLLCLAALAAGVILPVAPRWGDAVVRWPSRSTPTAGGSAASLPPSSRSHGPAFKHDFPPESGDPGPPRLASEAVLKTGAARSAPRRAPVRATTAPADAWRVAAQAAAGTWAVVVLALVSRLAGGWLLVSRLRRGVLEVDGESARLLGECRTALGLSRPVRLAIHPAVATPVVVGGPRPMVLVPTDWGDWPEPHHRACLMHELAHLARYDDWSKLAQELLRAPFFFHPLVHWLLRRLDREREILCDEATVALGADPVAYARLLLDLARRPVRLLSVVPRARTGWLPFLERRTLKVRINRLLEADMPRTSTRPSAWRSFLLGSLAVAAALGVAGLQVRAVSAGPAEPPKRAEPIVERPKPTEVAAPAPVVARDLPQESRGRVVDPDGRPVPGAAIAVTVKLPVADEAPKGVAGPRDVAPDEIAGVVVDIDGKPIEGAEVDAWTWHPGHEAKTDAKGSFRIGKLDKGRKVEVIVRKPGYTPQLFLTQPTGAPGWRIVLGNTTYFEGRVTDPNGKPVAGALVRANNGPKQADGVMLTEIWTEATADKDGHYRMYAQADVYDIQVRVPGVGVARLTDTSLGADEAKRLDIRLAPGVAFRAKVVDSLTGDPVAGVRLWHWQHPGIEGRSVADGIATVADLMPGRFNFQVEAPGYARWWSEEAVSAWCRRMIDPNRNWQRNFDSIDFDIMTGMGPVTIAVERGVTVTGRVLDPDGKPVAGATVAPALTGSGNSLTGDTRFSVETRADGNFTVVLPASGDRDYNLVAHDGKYGQWRTWANGVLPPIRTKPGEALRDVELRLTRPATVRGRVTDAAGRPVLGREVRTSAADRRENRYYDPTVTTADDGSYELKFVRPGEQLIQVAPFWLDPGQAPEGTSRVLTLATGESKAGVDFRLP